MMRRNGFALWILPALVGILFSCAKAPEGNSIVEMPVAEDPTITFKVWFAVGSQDDPVGKAGLAALTAEMIADASTETHAYDEILERLYPMAASYGISVDREMTVLTGRVHRDNLDEYFSLFSDAYLRPAFSQEDFDRIQSDTLNYLENGLRYQADEELGKAALYSFIFEGTRYAHPAAGLVEQVRALTLDDVKAFYRARFTRGNAQLALGGGFDAALVARFEQTLERLPEGQPEGTAAPTPPPIESTRLLLVDKPDADSSISFGFPIDVQRGERDYYALWIANSWLGEHRNSASHLYKVIRELRGMNYGDYSYIEAFTGGGRRQVPPSHVGRRSQIFEVWIRTLPNAQAHFALRAAVRELKMLVEGGMSPEEFELTRSFLKKYALHFADTTSGRLGYAVDDRFYGIDGSGHLTRFREMMDSITLEEVNAALQRHLRWDRLKIAMVTGDAAGLIDAIVEEKASPMSYESEKTADILAEDKEIESFPLNIAADAVRIIPVGEIFKE